MPYQLNQKKNIAILGFGREGKSTYEFLTQHQNIKPENITILDNNEAISTPSEACWQTGEDYLTGLEAYDLIIRSSGVSLLQEELQTYKKNYGTIISHMTLFFSEYQGKVIGITGTKGKTTISQLTFNVLQRAGLEVALVGNIGKPALTSISWEKPPKYVVCELSSYMLEDACPSCDIAIISNLYHEHHAIRHGSVEAYHKAKWNITNHAKNILIGSQIQHIPSTVHPYTKFGGDETYGVRSEGIYHKNHKIINLTDIKLLGNHNYYNICAVVGVCDILGIETKHLISELRLFHGVEHRLEYVGQYNHIHRYNDAIASTPESTIAALQTLPNTQTLFLGGKDGGYSFDELIQTIQQSDIKNIVCYPETGKQFIDVFASTHQCYLATDFEEGIQWANNQTQSGKIALLSCGSAYTLGIPFVEKGNRFKQYVQQC